MEENERITLKDQLKKFLIKGLAGFQTVLCFGLGRKLGIFDYLNEKASKNNEDTNSEILSVQFSPDELSNTLNLNQEYLNAWLRMCIDVGLFEVFNKEKKLLITAPHVYSLLVNREGYFYIGNNIALFYLMAPFQNKYEENFKTGEIIDVNTISPEYVRDGHKMSAFMGGKIEELFSLQLRDYRKRLRKGGFLLEVGCGYGFNLENWARKYRKTNITGIDIDAHAIEKAELIIKRNEWMDRVNLLHINIENFCQNKNNWEKYDVIMLNQVLHEMSPDEEYRSQIIKYLHNVLKTDGIMIIGESMIPDLFELKKGFTLFETMHKWFEVIIGSKFYNEDSIRKLIANSPFASCEKIQKGNDYFWVAKKE